MDHKTLKQFLPFVHRNQFPVCLWGATGVGKTTSIYEYAESVGAKLIVLHLATQEPGDLVGLPGREEMTREEQAEAIQNDMSSAGRTVWLRPEWMPAEDDPGKYIFFLDEFNRAPKYVLAAMFPFLLEGRMHTHKLPKDSWVLSAANPGGGDEYDVTEIHDKALISRLCHIKIKPNGMEWLERYDGKVHPAVHSVVSKEPTLLAFDNFELGFTVKPDARALTMMGSALQEIKDDEYNSFGFEFIEGCVGREAAAMIQKEWRNSLENISPKDILNSYSKIQKQVQQFSSADNARNDVLSGANRQLITMLKKMKKNLTDKQLKNLKGYIMDIPRDNCQGLLTNFTSGGNEQLDIFRDIMERLGDDDEVYQRMVEVNDPNAKNR